jgi:hypothetical protein
MLRFTGFINGRPLAEEDVVGIYMIGQENVPLRSEITLMDGEFRCRKQAMGPAAVALLWPVPASGKYLLETTRLPERDEPYILNVELARSRLQLVAYKQADWGLYDYHGGEDIYRRIRESEKLFIESLRNTDDPPKAARLADESLAISMAAGDDLSLFHAEIFLAHRKSEGRKETPFGCVVDAHGLGVDQWERLNGVFDHVTLPLSWQQIEPKEQEFAWDYIDQWVGWLARHPNLVMRGSPLVSFGAADAPDWLFVWENDFEHVRDLVYDHLTRVVERYGKQIKNWCVLSGIHRDNSLGLTFEQLMELTRLSANLYRRLQPGGRSVIDLVNPWGEYYARSQRTIPPVLYADVAVQSGVSFDCLGLQLMFGYGEEGYFLRDLLQVSNQLERFAALGKPLQLTAVGVPSSPAVDPRDRWGGRKPASAGGEWLGAWTEQRQADWLEKFCRIAFSKPYVESVTWRDLCDGTPHFLPHAGLLRADGSPKPAFERLTAIRKELFGPE